MIYYIQVSAEDKASGKTQKVTITSDKGRLSEDEIERMVAEAEENAEADKQARQKVEAKNQLEAYLYSLRSSAEDGLKDKLEEDDKNTLITTATEGLAWLDEHQDEEKDSYDEKRKEVEDVANPIISKAYDAGAPPQDGADPDGPEESTGPSVEEVEWSDCCFCV